MYASLSKLFLIEKEGEVGEKAEKESTELCLCFQMYQYSSCVFTDVTTAAGSCTLFDLFDFFWGVCVSAGVLYLFRVVLYRENTYSVAGIIIVDHS